MLLLGGLLWGGCDSGSLEDDSQKREEEMKSTLTYNVVDTKNLSVDNFIVDYTYEYFAVGDPEWDKVYKEALSYALAALRGLNAEGLYTVSGIENLGDMDPSWRRTERCEGLWNVVLTYREKTVEVVNGLDRVVCRYKCRDAFARRCNFVGYRKREPVVEAQGIYAYSPMTEGQVPVEFRNKRNNNGYYDSHESYKNAKGQEAFLHICESIEDDYLFDYENPEKPVTYLPPAPPPTGGGQGSSGGNGTQAQIDARRPYKYENSVDAYTVLSEEDVKRETLYIYKGPEGRRASWIYDPKGLAYNATESIRSGSATIDGQIGRAHV